ncbi:MAG TPA: hypothetical protein PK335_06440 [Draconibacterium sp.]|nr:hypothetical protein [Draconibacterium sp.]
MKTSFFILLTLFLLITSQLWAQVSDPLLVRIETSDGNEYIGTIVREDEQILVLKTETLGEITVQKASIKNREVIRKEQIREGEVWFENPQSTRYFWAPNAYGLKKGEGYYQNIYVFWNQFTFGLSDNFSLGGGVIPLFLLGGGPTPIFLTGKVSVPLAENKVNLGAGALVGAVVGEDAGSFGIVYGVSTFGDPDKNFSLGLGYAFAGGEWASSPLINLSGMVRASKRMYFLTENYYVHADGEGGGIIGLGGRWLIKKASLDFIFIIPFGADMDTFIAFPAIGFVIPIGKG